MSQKVTYCSNVNKYLFRQNLKNQKVFGRKKHEKLPTGNEKVCINTLRFVSSAYIKITMQAINSSERKIKYIQDRFYNHYGIVYQIRPWYQMRSYQ